MRPLFFPDPCDCYSFLAPTSFAILPILGDFAGKEAPELLGRTARRVGAEGEKSLAHVRQRHRLDDFGVEALHDVARRAGGPRAPACHVETSNPGNADSASVGNSGAVAERLAVVTASARSLPAFTCVMASEIFANISCAWPESRSVIAGGRPCSAR
jgi:hypothetical protein